ncbi:MAG: hypothetical protein KOO62_02335 [candidate division Zixibacteria bacterium]|nr:hypothetical protein [candidate division Zixibacteria bacterium]
MIRSKLSRLTGLMIYGGTLLLSILSFFTTFYGMQILLGWNLALIGSLGLQAAMLGIAWSLLRTRERRGTYIAAFVAAATFSVFFSYANFDDSLNGATRMTDARAEFAATARPVLTEYAQIAKKAAHEGQYQTDRIEKLIELENTKGWATDVDEGTEDRFLQSVIDGARRTIASWEKYKGTTYKQGAGQGIIVNYLESRMAQAVERRERIVQYIALNDSIALALSSNAVVKDQFDQVNRAYVSFPLSHVTAVMTEMPTLPTPPDPAEFVEVPNNGQEAFRQVVNDLLYLDPLAAFSLALAIVIDLIIILMAFAGSRLADGDNYIFERLRMHTAKSFMKMKLDDNFELSRTLSGDLQRYRQAADYRLEQSRIIQGYIKDKRKIKLRRGPEVAAAIGNFVKRGIKLVPWPRRKVSDLEPEQANDDQMTRS